MDKYYYLKEGETIKEGDEVDMSIGWNDDPVWQKTTLACSKVPDPQYPAHRRYRRKVRGE